MSSRKRAAVSVILSKFKRENKLASRVNAILAVATSMATLLVFCESGLQNLASLIFLSKKIRKHSQELQKQRVFPCYCLNFYLERCKSDIRQSGSNSPDRQLTIYANIFLEGAAILAAGGLFCSFKNQIIRKFFSMC